MDLRSTCKKCKGTHFWEAISIEKLDKECRFCGSNNWDETRELWERIDGES